MFVKVYAPYCKWPRSNSFISEMCQPESQTSAFLDSEKEEENRKNLELQQQIQLSSLLNQINNSIRSTLDLDEVLKTACTVLGDTLNCSRVSILVNDSEESSALIARGEYNPGGYPSQLGVQVPVANNEHLQRLILQPQPLAVTRFLEFPGLSAEARQLAKELRIQSMLAIATRYQGRVNGVIGLHQCDREREWTDWEKQLLEGVASQLAIAINQAQLYSATRAAAERESLLRLVTNQIRSTLDLKTILQTAVRGVRQLLHTDRVVIYQFQQGWEGEIVVEDLEVPWPSIFGDIVRDNCFSGEYAEQYKKGRVRAINDIHNAGLNSCHANFLASLQVKANLIVPISLGEKLWGLLIAHECGATRVWQSEETELLRQLGDQMAIAIAQAELYAQVQESATRSKAQAEQLQATLEELKSTQQQLIQSEKLSSLGQMVAGIAHEINNANNFIHANLPHARDYAESLIQAIDILSTSTAFGSESTAVFERFKEERDLDYIREDFLKMMHSMQQGSDRIRAIVLTLREFSNLDCSEFKLVNLNEGIESSLAMLQHRVKLPIKIHKYYGNLPRVECRPAQVNQVFFHLLDNALDAIESQGEKGGELTITTARSKPEGITISIRDNGPGIAPEIKDRIFDPFFTTKPVGKGTGLGLSLCYQAIVKSHGGRIECISDRGQGTEFVVYLPLSPS